MRAAQVIALDGPAGVRVHDIGPEPTAGPGEVLIDVHAVGLGFPDLLMSQGRYQIQPEPPYVPGLDFAGRVREDAPDTGFRAGDRVAGWSTYGNAAEVVAVPADRVFPLPAALGFAEGAALPLNYLTAHFALVHRARVSPDDVVLVTGAAGGVGSAAVQVARARGARVIAAVTSETEGEVAQRAGAHEVLIGFTSAGVRDLTDGRGADITLDVVGSEEIVLEVLRGLAVGGRLLTLGYVAGQIPSVRLNRLLLNNLDVSGVAWGPWVRAFPGFSARQWTDLMPMIEAGWIRPIVDRVRPLEEIAEAMDAMLARRAVGKTVLSTRPLDTTTEEV